MLVRNYGLYWATRRVFWSQQGGESGSLLGVPATKRTEKPTDFRGQVAIYALYNEFKPVYVGQTGQGKKQRLWRRLRHHRRDHLAGRWDSFSWFGLVPVNARNRRLRVNYRIKPSVNDVLNHIEAILTAVIEPPLNLQRGRFGDAEQFLQADDPNLPRSDRQLLEDISTGLENLSNQ